MEQRLAATRQSGPDALALGHPSPVGGGSDRSVMRGETDQDGIAAVFLAHQLTYVQLAALAHFRRLGVPQVRIMRPNDDLRAPILSTEMRHQRIERLDHVTVAQVPRRHLFEKHRAVILFGVFDQSGILLSVEELILRDAIVAPRVLRGPTPQLDKLADHFVPARFAAVRGCDETVDLRVWAEMIETRVTGAGTTCRIGVDPFKILNHGFHRGVQTVKIEPVKPGLAP